MTLLPLNSLRTVLYPSGPVADVERAQPTESAPVGNTGVRQVSHSANPPLNPQQAQQLSQPLSAVEHYERVVPELKTARQAARALDAQANGLPPGEVAKRRMLLEGTLLLKNPNLDFYLAAELLDLGMDPHKVMAARVPNVDITELQAEIKTLVQAPEVGLPTYQSVHRALDKGLCDTAKHLEGHEAFFHQTLQGTLSSAEREQIKAGHSALVEVAGHYQGAFEQLSKNMLTLVRTQLATAQATLDSHQTDSPERAQAAQQLQQWQALKDDLAKQVISPNPVDKAAQRIQLDDHVTALNARRKSWFNQFTTASAEGIAQGMASSTLFLLARAYIDPRLSVFSLVSQSMANGVTMGAVHETLDNFVKPTARELLANMGMRETEEVPVGSLIHDPARATVVDGRYYERTDTEMAAEQTQIEHARAGFLNNQNDYKTGTLRGDALTYLNQPMAQMVRQLLSVTTSLNTGSVAARAITSFAGGMGMSAAQALGKVNNTYHHDGRDLPTHVPKAVPEASLFQRLSKVGNKATPTIDPRQSDTRENYASKIWSASEGMLFYNAIGRGIGKLDTTTGSGASGSVVLANLQAIALLLPFYANRQSGSEAKADASNRANSAIANMFEPDRDTLAHGTQPGSVGRQVENFYNRVRGINQLAPQTATMLTEAAVGATVHFGKALGALVNRRTDRPSANTQPPPVAPNPPRLSLGDIHEPVDLEAALGVLAEPDAPVRQPPGAWPN